MKPQSKMSVALYEVMTSPSSISNILGVTGEAIAHVELIGKSKFDGVVTVALRPAVGGNIQLHQFKFRATNSKVSFYKTPATWVFEDLKLDGLRTAIDGKVVMTGVTLRNVLFELVRELGGPGTQELEGKLQSVTVMMSRDKAKSITQNSKWLDLIADPAHSKRF